MIQKWWLAARPRTLAVSLAAILVGQACAYFAPHHLSQYFSWWLALVALACALSLQVSVNLANDYFDFLSGVDGAQRLGPERAAQQGWLTLTQLKLGFIASLLLGMALGLMLVIAGGTELLWLGGLCVLAVLGYTGGPFPLAYRALGELAVFVVFGPIAVLGSVWLHYGAFAEGLLWPGFSMGALAAAIMLVNNIRDLDTDRRAGKKTLVHYCGEHRSRLLYQSLIISSLVAMWVYLLLAGSVPLISLLLMLPARKLLTQFSGRHGEALNQQLGQTAQFMLLVALCSVMDRVIGA